MEQINQAIIEFLKIFCDESRLAIIEYLKDSRKTQTEIQNHLEKSQSRISQNLKILILAGIIGFDQEGVKKTYYLKDSRVFKLIGMVVSMISAGSDERSEFLQSLDMMDLLL